MELEADVAIVGAGVAGLSAARLLTLHGLRCCLILGAHDQTLVRMLVEGYHGAPLADVSAAVVAEDAASSSRDFKQYRTANGYDQVALLNAGGA